jgi:vancomycin permeability regulator SanA
MKSVLLFIKRFKWWIIGVIVFIAILIWGAWVTVYIATASVRYDSTKVAPKDVPSRSVAIVFGASESNGVPSPYLLYRVEAAVSLYKAGRVKKLLMSGDNSTLNYDEPVVMQKTAIKLGVKPQDIVLDYAGFSTYDTCYRAIHIFGVTQAILVSQNYHLPRAIFTCDSLGVQSIGYGAYATEPLLQFQYTIREWFSTDKTVVQLLFNRQSKYLGPKELITT